MLHSFLRYCDLNLMILPIFSPPSFLSYIFLGVGVSRTPRVYSAPTEALHLKSFPGKLGRCPARNSWCPWAAWRQWQRRLLLLLRTILPTTIVRVARLQAAGLRRCTHRRLKARFLRLTRPARLSPAVVHATYRGWNTAVVNSRDAAACSPQIGKVPEKIRVIE